MDCLSVQSSQLITPKDTKWNKKESIPTVLDYANIGDSLATSQVDPALISCEAHVRL